MQHASDRQRIINVSNRLPVTVREQGVRRSSGGLVAALEGVPAEKFDIVWVGWPGAVAHDDRPRLRQLLDREHGLVPVFLEPEEAAAHYEGLSNSSLWPLLHYMPSKFEYESGWWDYYVEVNRRFADAVLLQVRDGDELVWVHDYQLMLLPRMLKQARRSLRIGFFLHTPFPSYEVFRCHPDREALVEGVLGADLVGFHTFGYLRHFRSTAMRLLDLEANITHIRHEGGHDTRMGVYPIGIHAQKFDEEISRPEFREELARLRAAHEGKRVVLSVERLDYSKGLTRRLDAIELFLRNTGRAEEMRFIFVAVPSREGVREYRMLTEEVEGRVGRINGRYSTIANQPVQFVHQSVSFTELCALYALAEVALVTPVMDGMNLVAKEYVACQRPGPGVDPGVLVLSEFAGAAEVLFDALIVNPYDVDGVAEAIERALLMPAEERARRMSAMRDRVMRFDAAWWARGFVEDLQKIGADAAPPQPETAHCAPEEVARQLGRAVRDGRRVALFLDYDGTLREIVRDPKDATPNDEIHRLMDLLRRRRDVTTTIISGRTREDLDSFLGDYREFALIAEHGAALRRPGSGEWEQLDRNVSYRWKQDLLPVLRSYEATTPGSSVEEKRTSLVWHFRRADPEFGEWKARQLVGELEAVVANQPLNARLGRKIVEITATQVNKAAAVMRLLEEARYDLLIVAGDDVTDESMYRLELANMISINVGERQTQAMCVLPDPAALRTLLTRTLAEV